MTCPPDPTRTFDDAARIEFPTRDDVLASQPRPKKDPAAASLALAATGAALLPASHYERRRPTDPTGSTETLSRRARRSHGPRGPIHDRTSDVPEERVDFDPRAFALLAAASALAAITVGVLTVLAAWA